MNWFGWPDGSIGLERKGSDTSAVLDLSRFISASLSFFGGYLFELSGRYSSEGRMPSVYVVKSVDVFEKRICQLLTCLPGMSPNQLRLQCFEECF